mmetsp:Transcript_17038/g.30848  ORF Transcript_17038/g.30848 Transcript_17038/m.30848 type:complete len:322 (+) Transcript_17038:774-1739(+)
MTDISVHDSKEKGESCCRKEGRVGLSITRNTVRIDKLLVSVGKLVGGKVCGRSWPRLGNVIDKTGHGHVHVGVRTVDSVANFIKALGNDPTFTTKHTGHISLEHVERMVDTLFAKNNPSPLFSMLGQHLAKTEASILILEKDGTRINKLLSILSQHGIHGRGIVHVGKRVTVGTKGIANLLELDFNGGRLEKDNENALFNKLPRFRVGNGLLDGSKANVAVTTSSTENHAFKASLFFRCNNARNRGETHVHIAGRRTTFRFQKTIATVVGDGTVIGRSTSGEFRNSKTGSIGHEEATRLFKHFLKLHLFIVLGGELFVVIV